MISSTDLIVISALGFCTYGIAYILRYTDGPFDIFIGWRKIMGIKYTESEDTYTETIGNSHSAKLAGCFWCISTWVAAILAVICTISLDIDIIYGFIAWLYSIGFAGYLHERSSH